VSFFYNPLLSTSSTHLFSKTRIELLYAVRLQSAGALLHLLLASLIIFFAYLFIILSILYKRELRSALKLDSWHMNSLQIRKTSRWDVLNILLLFLVWP